MKRYRLLGLAGVLLLGLLGLFWWMGEQAGESDWDLASRGTISVRVADDVELQDQEGEGPARSGLDAQAGETGESTSETENTGELRFLSEREFHQRLLELGGGDPKRIFDRIHEQQPDRGSVWVLVTDGEKRAVDRAQVRLTPPSLQQPTDPSRGPVKVDRETLSQRTAFDGVALFANVPPRAYLLAVQHDEYLNAHQAQVEAVAGESTYVEIRLEKARETIAGVVVDEAGAPLWGATVSTWRYTEGGLSFGRSMVT
ncbi:MAG: carboxypeptidase regulatory-like domain-containing protein, partial [Planctomycetes bacterium]|nr:carboxypeptidase regulatory-like domain-containing protein [Planctomycetota bacterium]